MPGVLTAIRRCKYQGLVVGLRALNCSSPTFVSRCRPATHTRDCLMSGANIAVVGPPAPLAAWSSASSRSAALPRSNAPSCLASSRSAGTKLPFMGDELVVEEATPDAFEGADVVFFAAGGGTSKALAPEAARRGAVVVDKSSAWRMDDTVPLVIPEINGGDLAAHNGIISSPNCSTIVMLMALAPLHRANPITRVIVDTYQSASGAGARAVAELYRQTTPHGSTTRPPPPRRSLIPALRLPFFFNVLRQRRGLHGRRLHHRRDPRWRTRPGRSCTLPEASRLRNLRPRARAHLPLRGRPRGV